MFQKQAFPGSIKLIWTSKSYTYGPYWISKLKAGACFRRFSSLGQNVQPALYLFHKLLAAKGNTLAPLVTSAGSVPQKYSGPTPVVLSDLFVIVSVPAIHKV